MKCLLLDLCGLALYTVAGHSVWHLRWPAVDRRPVRRVRARQPGAVSDCRHGRPPVHPVWARPGWGGAGAGGGGAHPLHGGHTVHHRVRWVPEARRQGVSGGCFWVALTSRLADWWRWYMPLIFFLSCYWMISANDLRKNFNTGQTYECHNFCVAKFVSICHAIITSSWCVFYFNIESPDDVDGELNVNTSVPASF